MKKSLKLYALLGVMILLVGCPAKPLRDDSSATAGSEQAAQEREKGSGADLGSSGFKGHPLDDPSSPLSKRVFYFAFDSSHVRVEDREAIAAHAIYMAQHPEVSVVLEGHADERGTREYNMALGEQRAKAVSQLIILQGAVKGQIQIISFGEERPLALGHNEADWRLNRRVEILYAGY